MRASVWYCRTSDVDDSDHRDRCYALLDAPERERHRRLIPPARKLEYLVAHALLREVLGEAVGAPPGSLSFTADSRGKPELALARAAGLEFSLSHADGLVTCAIAPVRVGVDAEDISRRVEPLSIAEHDFAREEVADLRGRSDYQMRRRFFELWTLKESYLKAIGIGLEPPLASLVFFRDGAAPGGVRVDFRAPLTDHPSRWRFELLEPGEPWLIAVAVETDAPRDAQFTFTRRVPRT